MTHDGPRAAALAEEVSPGKRLRVLIIEDSEDDAELLAHALRKGGYTLEILRVEDEASMRGAFVQATWDLVISDWTVPGFGALRALSVHRELGVDTPFIVVSGTIGEEHAVEAMRAGAHDFVLKDRPARLLPAVARGLAEARLRAEQRAMREQLRASEEALARSAKLRALGQMAAGISHDLKNILNPLSLHLQFLKRAVGSGAPADVHESIDDMKHVLARGLEMLDRLRQFSRKEPEARVEEVDVNWIAREAIEIARPRMASRATVSCAIREELGQPPRIAACAAELVSAIVNLIVNAIDAVHSGGQITVRTGQDRGGAWIEVADDGPGMPPEVEQRVFEPFFTTKGQEGTGLGLAMVYATVSRYDGSISLRTAPEEGASFTLWFPGIGPRPA